jgi:hypothetical protein
MKNRSIRARLIPYATTIPSALLFFAPAGLLSAAGNGSTSNPYTDNEVTRAILDKGGTAANPNCSSLKATASTNLEFDANQYNIFIGGTTPYNYLYVSGGASFGDVCVQIGSESGSDHNLVELKDEAIDADSNKTLSVGDKGLYVGNKGSDNTLKILSDADVDIGENSVWIGCASSNNAVLVDGAGSTLDVSQYEGSSIFVGLDGSDNSLTVSNEAKVWTYDLTLGGYTPKNNGTGNTITVTGYDSLIDVTHYCVVGAGTGNGAPGTNNSLTVANGGSFYVIGGDFDLSGGSKASNKVTVTGANSILDVHGTLTVDGRYNRLTATSNGRITCLNLKLNNFNIKVLASGAGASIATAGSLNIPDDDNVTIDDGALVKVGDADDDTLSLDDPYHQDSGRYIRFSEGYLAWYGNRADAIKALADAGRILIRNNVTLMWDKAAYSDLKVAYYSASQETDAKAATGFTGLAGYTVVTGGHKLTPNQSWYKCSWYGGGFYASNDAFDQGGWVYHFTHGWQFIYEDSAYDGVYAWDFGLGFTVTSQILYPYIYSYTYGRWFYYKSGSYPNRVLWDYKAGGWVNEPDIVK